MAGSWEIKQSKSVLVCILHTDVVTLAWSFGFRNLIIPGPPPLALSGMPFDHARNTACKSALEQGVDWLFFLDSDVVVPHDAILRLMTHNKPFISGMYRRRSPPVAVPVMIRNGSWVTDFPQGQVIDVDLVGAGCLLIHRDLLLKCPPQRPQAGKTWFDWRVDCQGILPPGECLSEDFTMNLHIKRTMGIPTLVDTSVRCRHIGYGEADENGVWKPMETRSIT